MNFCIPHPLLSCGLVFKTIGGAPGVLRPWPLFLLSRVPQRPSTGWLYIHPQTEVDLLVGSMHAPNRRIQLGSASVLCM
jgi:hypothetical protein